MKINNLRQKKPQSRIGWIRILYEFTRKVSTQTTIVQDQDEKLQRKCRLNASGKH